MRSLLSHKFVGEGLAVLGMFMIGYSVFVFDKSIPFPSIYALVPTVGAGLIIIFASSQTLVGRLLSTRVFVGIGVISYSAYLWHQPLLAFTRHRSLTEPSELTFAVVAALSLPLAYLSWEFIEKPFRKKGVFSRKKIFIFSLIGAVVFITIGVSGHVTNGWPDRFSDKLQIISEPTKCGENKFSPEYVCSRVKEASKLTLLIGDSHSGAIGHEMELSFTENKIGLLHIYKEGCPSVKNVYRADTESHSPLGEYSCYQFNKNLYDFIAKRDDIENIVISVRWALWIEGSRFNNMEGGVEISEKKPHLDLVDNGKPLYHPHYGHRLQIAERYIYSVQMLLDAGKKVILVYPIPEAGWNVPNYLLKRLRVMSSKEVASLAVGSTSYKVFQERNRRAYNALDKIAQHPNLYRVYPESIFCNADVKGRCIVQKDGVPFYRDDDHLSDTGAKLLVNKIIEYVVK